MSLISMRRLGTVEAWLDEFMPLFRKDDANYDLIMDVAKQIRGMDDRSQARFSVVRLQGSGEVIQAIIRNDEDSPTIFSPIYLSPGDYIDEETLAELVFEFFQHRDFEDWSLRSVAGPVDFAARFVHLLNKTRDKDELRFWRKESWEKCDQLNPITLRDLAEKTQIEYAKSQDIDALLILYQDFLKKVYSMDPLPIEFLRPKFINAVDRKHVYVIRAPGNELASFCIIAKDSDSKFGHIHALYTAKSFESKGFGTNLVYHVTQEILKDREAALLGVDLRNPRSTFIYRKVGFKQISQADVYCLPELIKE